MKKLENHYRVKKIELSSGTKIISDPQSVADMLNTSFVEIIDDLKSK
jgi:hypothetical protein